MADMMIPEGWKNKTLDEVATVFAGGTPSRSNQAYYDGGIPWVKSGEVNKRFVYYTEETISELAVQESSARWAKSDSVLIAMYGATAGKVAKLMIDATLNQAVSAINGKSKMANNDFLFYAIENKSQELLNTVQGSGQPNLSGALIKSLNLAIPPLPEQQKIATILSSVDTVIEKTRAQIDKLKHLKTGMMQQLLTQGIGHTEFKDSPVGRIPKAWEVKTLGDLIKSMDGGVSVNGENREKGLNEIGVLKVSSVFKGQFLPQEHKAVVPEDVSRVRLNPKKDHILFSRANTPLLVGESAYIDKDYHDLFLPDKLWMIDVKSRAQVNVKWLSYILCSDQVRKDITDVATGSSSTMKNISKPSLLGISTVLPPIIEQKKISDMLQSVDEKTIVTIQKLKKLTKIKKALMQDLLTGKVRVQSLKKL